MGGYPYPDKHGLTVSAVTAELFAVKHVTIVLQQTTRRFCSLIEAGSLKTTIKKKKAHLWRKKKEHSCEQRDSLLSVSKQTARKNVLL